MKRILVALGIALSPLSPGVCGEIADHAAKADAALAAGDGRTAVSEFDAAQDALWNAMPLTVRKAVLVDSASGVGVYVPRATPVFQKGEKIVVYIEPIGYGYGSDGIGNVSMAMDIDLTLYSDAGKDLGTVENIGSISLTSRARNRELYFNLTLTLEPDSVPPGKYRGEFLIHDRNSPKTAKFSVDFELAG